MKGSAFAPFIGGVAIHADQTDSTYRLKLEADTAGAHKLVCHGPGATFSIEDSSGGGLLAASSVLLTAGSQITNVSGHATGIPINATTGKSILLQVADATVATLNASGFAMAATKYVEADTIQSTSANALTLNGQTTGIDMQVAGTTELSLTTGPTLTGASNSDVTVAAAGTGNVVLNAPTGQTVNFQVNGTTELTAGATSTLASKAATALTLNGTADNIDFQVAGDSKFVAGANGLQLGASKRLDGPNTESLVLNADTSQPIDLQVGETTELSVTAGPVLTGKAANPLTITAGTNLELNAPIGSNVQLQVDDAAIATVDTNGLDMASGKIITVPTTSIATSGVTAFGSTGYFMEKLTDSTDARVGDGVWQHATLSLTDGVWLCTVHAGCSGADSTSWFDLHINATATPTISVDNTEGFKRDAGNNGTADFNSNFTRVVVESSGPTTWYGGGRRGGTGTTGQVYVVFNAYRLA